MKHTFKANLVLILTLNGKCSLMKITCGQNVKLKKKQNKKNFFFFLNGTRVGNPFFKKYFYLSIIKLFFFISIIIMNVSFSAVLFHLLVQSTAVATSETIQITLDLVWKCVTAHVHVYIIQILMFEYKYLPA